MAPQDGSFEVVAFLIQKSMVALKQNCHFFTEKVARYFLHGLGVSTKDCGLETTVDKRLLRLLRII